MNCRILIVEDEPKLREVLCDYFRSKGELPEEAEDGLGALELLEEETFDAVLLDIMMPGLNGLNVCRAVRRNSDVPIIFLTALSDEEDKLLGYELGADDYVTKPFTMSVLYAKLAALVRRNRRNVLAGDRMESGGITVDLARQKVFAGKQEVALTPKEFDILCFLARNRGEVFTKEQIYQAVWESDYLLDDSNIMAFIRKLRKKIEPNPDAPEYILTIWGIGYKFSDKL